MVVNSSSVGSVVNISERALALLALFLVRHSQMFEFVMVSIKKQQKKELLPLAVQFCLRFKMDAISAEM